MFSPSKIKLITCCCCCGPGRGVGRLVGGLTPDELGFVQELVAGRFIAEGGGRSCGDFFKTLLPTVLGPGDPALAGRETLLTKVGNLEDLQALFTGVTVCVRAGRPIAVPVRRVSPPARDFPKEIIVATWRNLDPFGTPTGLGFIGTTDDYLAWKFALIPSLVGGVFYTARRQRDRSEFDSFCIGALCP